MSHGPHSDASEGSGSADTAGDDVATAPPAGQHFRVRRVVRGSGTEQTGDAERVVSRDETDVGWGDGPGDRDDDWYRRERPPHHE